MEKHLEVDVCGSWMEIFGNGNGTGQVYAEHKKIVTSMLLTNTMFHPTVILRKSSVYHDEPLYKVGYDCAEDYKLWTDLAIRGCHFANIPEVLLRYRNSDKQVINIRQKEMCQSILKIQMEYSEQIMQQIVEKDEKFFEFFENLIQSLHRKLISPSKMLNMVYQIFMDYPDGKCYS
jgi:hypothetical protein